jgi:serine/threonine protein kinase
VAVDLIGQTVGSYRAVKKLGAGGMGTVYLCEHTLIDRKVAVKVLHDEYALDDEQVGRFFQEARAAAEIGHPNIIVIIDAGYMPTPAGPRPFMMMEALSGQSLDKRLATGGLSLEDIRHILGQCASALSASHGKGIIHRDLKPANIYLCDHGFDPMFVKILDFGIAKLTTPDHSARRTQFGIVLGTPHFMSPEQCEGKGAIDHRSDIYSLGVVLYQMLTGTVPFDGTVTEILLAHMNQRPPPPSTRNPSVPPAWEALCLRMLEPNKADRPQSMQEVGDALADLEGHAAIYAAAQAARATSGHSGHTLIATAAPDGVVPDVDAGSRPTMRADLRDLLANAPPTPGHGTPIVPTPAGGVPVLTPSHVVPIATPGHGIPIPMPFPMPTPGHGSAIPMPTPGHGTAIPMPTPGSGVPVAPMVTHPSGPIAVDAIAAHCGALVMEHRFDVFPDFLLRQASGEWLDVAAVCHAVGVAPPPPGADVRVAWLEHPRRDPRLASIVFFCPATLWSAVLIHRRP